MNYSNEQLETALKSLYASGEMDKAKVIATEIQKRRDEARNPFLKYGGFMGSERVAPPSARDVKAAEGIPRQLVGDAVMAPSQVVAGVADFGAGLASKAGMPYANTSRMSTPVSALRNQIAGRPGTDPGAATGVVQGVATLPFNWMTQAVGLGAGLARPEEDPVAEGGKSALTAGAFNTLAKVIGPSVPRSQADARLRNIAKSENIPMTMGTQSNSQLMKEVERRAERNILLGGIGGTNYATRTREGIDDTFARQLWKRTGMEFDEFTQANIKLANRELGKVFQQPFAGGPVMFRSMELQHATKNASSITPQLAEEGGKVLSSANTLVTRHMKDGKLSADSRNVLMDELRGLRSKAYDEVKSKSAGDAIGDLMSAVNATVVKALPSDEARSVYMDTMKKWANLKVIEDAFVRSGESARGNLDYTKLKAAIERNMPGGYVSGKADLTDLADLGMAMKGGQVLPEGVKINPVDPMLYMMYNNPLALAMRQKNPVDAKTLSATLRAAGIQLNTE